MTKCHRCLQAKGEGMGTWDDSLEKTELAPCE